MIILQGHFLEKKLFDFKFHSKVLNMNLLLRKIICGFDSRTACAFYGSLFSFSRKMMNFRWLALISGLALTADCIDDLFGSSTASEMPLTLLSDAQGKDKGAVCLDGSNPGFYYKQGAEKTKWVLYFKGGGWCYDEDSCYSRSLSEL